MRASTNAIIGRVCLIIAMALTLLIGSYSGYSAITRLDKLRTSGKVVQGEVYNIEKVSTKSDANYKVSFRFEINDQMTVGEARMTPQESGQYAYGAPITVTALPDAPTINVVGTVNTEKVDGLRNKWILGTTVVFVILALVLYAVELTRVKQTKMLSTYDAVPVVILEIGPPSKDKSPMCDVTYRFRYPDGSIDTQTDRLGATSAQKYSPGQATTALLEPGYKSAPTLLSTLAMVECV